MGRRIEVFENGLSLVFDVAADGDVRLLHGGCLPFEEGLIGEKAEQGFRVLEVQLSGEDRDEYHGRSHRASYPGLRMKYSRHYKERNETGLLFALEMNDPETGLETVSFYQFHDGLSVFKSWTELRNKGAQELGIEYVSSFSLNGLAKDGEGDQDDKMKLHLAHNGWQSEVQWRSNTLPELGLAHMTDRSSKRVSLSNTGSWAAAEHLPMALLENEEVGTTLFWQIEHNGSWHWELLNQFDHLSLSVSGPSEHDHGWWKKLLPGESFVSVPVAAGFVRGGFEEGIGELTRYRRAARRPNTDNEKLRIIFNDYMNCLWGNPTTQNLLPLIDAAADVGCEYFCIDCGWYSPGKWWDGVGEWLPSEERFPEGIKYVLDYIRGKGMIPGLWLEIEVMGINSPKLAQTDDSWFFMRHGKRVKDRSRYQLDFRNPAVVDHADEVIRRLVEEYGVGYIKMDYNINAGVGTETDADSPGEGLLGHNRAYLAWIDRTFETYPELVIENCSSGGMRMDYAMLSRHSIQSTSDQEDYVKYAQIAASSPAALTPEQSAIWSYPLREGDDEEVVFNMVNALLLRVHQSGHLAELSAPRRELVREALDLYKRIRGDIREGLPFWPLGLPKVEDGWVSFGLRRGGKRYVAVWRLDAEESEAALPVSGMKGKAAECRLLYPQGRPGGDCVWDAEAGSLKVRLERGRTARLFEVTER